MALRVGLSTYVAVGLLLSRLLTSVWSHNVSGDVNPVQNTGTADGSDIIMPVNHAVYAVHDIPDSPTNSSDFISNKPIVYGFFVVEAMVGVSVTVVSVIVLIIHRTNHHHHNYVLFISLAVTDLLMGTVIVPLTIAVEVFHKPTSFFACLVSNSVINMLSTYTIISCCFISLDRLISIRYPALRTRPYAEHCMLVSVTASLLLVFILCCLLPLIYHPPDRDFILCHYKCVIAAELNVGVQICGFFLPVLVSMMTSHVLVLRSFRESNERMMQHSQWPSSKVVRELQQKKLELRLVKTMFAIVVLFLITWMPWHVLNILEVVISHDMLAAKLGPKNYWLWFYCAVAFSHLTSLLNTVMYCLANTELRRRFILVLLPLCTCGFWKTGMQASQVTQSERNLTRTRRSSTCQNPCKRQLQVSEDIDHTPSQSSVSITVFSGVSDEEADCTDDRLTCKRHSSCVSPGSQGRYSFLLKIATSTEPQTDNLAPFCGSDVDQKCVAKTGAEFDSAVDALNPKTPTPTDKISNQSRTRRAGAFFSVNLNCLKLARPPSVVPGQESTRDQQEQALKIVNVYDFEVDQATEPHDPSSSRTSVTFGGIKTSGRQLISNMFTPSGKKCKQYALELKAPAADGQNRSSPTSSGLTISQSGCLEVAALTETGLQPVSSSTSGASEVPTKRSALK